MNKIDLDLIPTEVNRDKLDRVLDDAFKEPASNSRRNTHAIVVVYKDRIIAERYADHISRDNPLLGWSMTKSWINALVGILVKDGKLDIMQPAPIEAWRGKDDPRGRITLDQLLRMSSGLEFEEVYGPSSDAVDMFYESKSMADYAAAKALKTAPDGEWYYSSGTTNIISRIVRDSVGGSLADVNKFARKSVCLTGSGCFLLSSNRMHQVLSWAQVTGLLPRGIGHVSVFCSKTMGSGKEKEFYPKAGSNIPQLPPPLHRRASMVLNSG